MNNIPDHITLLSMNATDIPGKTYNVILETANHFDIIVSIRSTYQKLTGSEAAYDDETQTITMDLTEEYIFQVIELIQEYAGRVETPETYPTEEEMNEHLYNLITTPTNKTPLDESEPPF